MAYNDTRITKNELHFGRIRMFRHPNVPHMDEGRNGDIVLIDTNDEGDEMSSVGLWIKVPLGDARAPSGTVVTGLPNTLSTFSTITINSVVVTLSEPDDLSGIATDITAAGITDIISIPAGSAIQVVNTAGGPITIGENSLGLYSLPAVADINTNGVWCPFSLSRNTGVTSRSIQFFVEVPDAKVYPILQSSGFDFTIVKMTGVTSDGTINATVSINGTPIPGLTEIALSNVPFTANTTDGDRDVSIGDYLSITTDTLVDPANLSISIVYQYNT
jgi:hypothetical protein